MKKYLVLLVSVLILAGCSKDSPVAPTPVVEYAVFDINILHFVVNNDGNSIVNGKFYYVVGIIDERDSIIRDENGKYQAFAIDRSSYISAGHNDKIIVNQSFRVKIAKQNGKSFGVRAIVYDYFSNGNDIVAGGYVDWKYKYPLWNFQPNSGMDAYKLKNVGGSYDIDFFYQIVNISGM